MKIVILAGGKGTRLWPLSREKYSKQFLKFINGKPLLEATYERALKIVNPEDVITITNEDYYFYVKEICSNFSTKMEENIICEPVGKNTLPAISLACIYVIDKLNSNDSEILTFFPSDHVIKPLNKFLEYMRTAESISKDDFLVTFGIKPKNPETGYGYIKLGESYGKYNKVEKFVEKPSLELAEKYLKEGNYFWNSGMFSFKISVFLEELKKYQPQIYELISKGYEKTLELFHEMPSISIDYGIMEKSDKVVVIPMDIFWSDVGSWDSFYDINEKDNNGNVKIGDVYTVDTQNSIIFSNKRLIATVGIEDSIIVETDDAILIAKRGMGQEVKRLLEELERDKREEIIYHTEIYKPWGFYKILEKGDRYKIYKIVIKPGMSLDMEMHHHRTEHWIIMKGTAEVEIGRKRYFLHEGESTFVPKSTFHKLKNSGKIPLEIIEIQSGEYLGEDDRVKES
jgi:mannose-1-phosphate guanylyltransferase/mannose-6-phosphate isomerase